MIRNVKAIVFDFDGTLVDASQAICASFRKVLGDAGGPALSDAEIRAMIGRPLREMFERVLPAAPAADIERCVEAYRDVFTPLSRPLSRPLGGLLEVVPRLARRVKLAIATSRTTGGAIHILEGFGLQGFFDVIVGIRDVAHCKPHPESVLTALGRLGIPAACGVMVGDTADDMLAGKAAGATAVGVDAGGDGETRLRAAGADYIIRDLRGLEALMEQPRVNGA